MAYGTIRDIELRGILRPSGERKGRLAMQISYESVTAQNPNAAPFSESATITPSNPSAFDFITCALQQVDQLGANGQAQIAITAYVQNGEAHEGNWPILSGTNITSVSFSLTVASARAAATVVMFRNE